VAGVKIGETSWSAKETMMILEEEPMVNVTAIKSVRKQYR
jgi:hypothetical protein